MFWSVPFCSLKCRGQFINEVSVLRINCKKARKTCFDGPALGLLCVGLPEPIERNPFNCVRLRSVSELNRTQSDGLSSIEFDFLDRIRFVRKSNSLKVWCSISFGCRTQSNSIHGLSSIEFDFRTLDWPCRVSIMDAYVFFLFFVTRHFELWRVRILSVATSVYSIGKVRLISSCLTEVSCCSKCCTLYGIK